MNKPSRRSIVAVLSEEHLKLQALSSELATASSTSDHVDVLTAWVSRHLSAEQRYLYPVVRDLLPEGERLIDEELNQDQLILRKLAALRSAPPQSLPHLADELVTDLRRHAPGLRPGRRPGGASAAPQQESPSLGASPLEKKVSTALSTQSLLRM